MVTGIWLELREPGWVASPGGLQSLAGAGGGQGSVWQQDQSEEWEAGRVCPVGQKEAAATWVSCECTQGAAYVSVVAHWCI